MWDESWVKCGLIPTRAKGVGARGFWRAEYTVSILTRISHTSIFFGSKELAAQKISSPVMTTTVTSLSRSWWRLRKRGTTASGLQGATLSSSITPTSDSTFRTGASMVIGGSVNSCRFWFQRIGWCADSAFCSFDQRTTLKKEIWI